MKTLTKILLILATTALFFACSKESHNLRGVWIHLNNSGEIVKEIALFDDEAVIYLKDSGITKRKGIWENDSYFISNLAFATPQAIDFLIQPNNELTCVMLSTGQNFKKAEKQEKTLD